MTSLIASLGKDPATIAHVNEVIKKQDWEKIYIITETTPNSIIKKDNIEFIIINSNQILEQLAENIRLKLKEKITDLEIALNLVSGNGKLHMAVLSALLKLGLGIRLVAITPSGIKEI